MDMPKLSLTLASTMLRNIIALCLVNITTKMVCTYNIDFLSPLQIIELLRLVFNTIWATCFSNTLVHTTLFISRITNKKS